MLDEHNSLQLKQIFVQVELVMFVYLNAFISFCADTYQALTFKNEAMEQQSSASQKC